ncbi:uncharacterized protein BXZ73DRAFT_50234 [Epithele typhae]|uniref:uncharacterized protein n=1 Tax=Epithele typhae TaxID=378194 RepID=UPI00200749B3|nr:uncharacterized protein BXZ73DRAFT_50234 [Epithele typhae]KAH9924986.1 hypothetical protein BXZ73DRAFT_50234 [Epithele typhae]
METIPDHEPSTSVSTLRGLRHLDMALLSEQSSSPAPEPAFALPQPAHDDPLDSPWPPRPSSPHSAQQSEPGSPSGDSVSSFPSVGSSFFFSSVPVTPPHPGLHSDPEDHNMGDSTSGLVIPSLLLPSPSRRPTPYGQTLGGMRLLLLGPKGADMSAIASQLVDDNEDVVEVGIWEEVKHEPGTCRGGRKTILRVSTDWVEQRDRHGLERVEPARNVEIVELPAYDPDTEADTVIDRVLPVIHSPFREVLEILSREHPPTGTLAHLLSSSCTPLYTALILLSDPLSFSSVERSLVEALSSHIPVILLPTPPSALLINSVHESSRYSSHISSFRPVSLDALRVGLFRTPNILASLRSEAASRFLRWREVERAVERVRWSTAISKVSMHPDIIRSPSTGYEKNDRWNKEAWEAQWEGTLSQEVALHLRRQRSNSTRRIAPLSSLSTVSRFSFPPASLDDSTDKRKGLLSPPCTSGFDPLHLPSLVVFSFTLLRAVGTRFTRALGLHPRPPLRRRSSTITNSILEEKIEEESQLRAGRGVGYTIGLGIAFVSAFCAGIGLGIVAATGYQF